MDDDCDCDVTMETDSFVQFWRIDNDFLKNVFIGFSRFLHLSVPMLQLGDRWAVFNEI
jgi:hypothetical protein